MDTDVLFEISNQGGCQGASSRRDEPLRPLWNDFDVGGYHYLREKGALFREASLSPARPESSDAGENKRRHPIWHSQRLCPGPVCPFHGQSGRHPLDIRVRGCLSDRRHIDPPGPSHRGVGS